MELIALVSLWSVWVQARPLQSQSLLIKQNSAHFLIAQSTSSQQHLPVNKQELKYLCSHSDGNSSGTAFGRVSKSSWSNCFRCCSIRNAPSSCFKQARYFYQKVVRKAGVSVASCVVTSVMTYLGWRWSSAQESQNPFHSSLVKYYRQQSKVTTSC